MYRYDQIDDAVVRDRAAEFRDQVARRLSGEITEAQFKPTCCAWPSPTAC